MTQALRLAPLLFFFSPLLSFSQNTFPSSGNVGIGTTTPAAPLHIVASAISKDAINQYSGNASIQANSGGRSLTEGAQLEFVIPANTDGTNFYSQARIITVAGNTNNSDATGKLIMGTRRLFDKGTGTGRTWNFGDDLIIDGSGNVGVGTLYPQSLFSVKGTITAQQLNITLNNWSDFVFDSAYQRASLDDIARYTATYKHLPGIPSAAEVKAGGLDVGLMEKLQMQKIEELTLYAIDADKRAERQDSVIRQQAVLLERLQEEVEVLKKQMMVREGSK